MNVYEPTAGAEQSPHLQEDYEEHFFQDAQT